MAGSLATAGARAAVPDGFYGLNVQQVFSGPDSTGDPHLSTMAGGGLQLARTDVRWSHVEPNPPSQPGQHSYDWSSYDAIVQAMAEHGVRWYPIVDYSTSWAGLIPGDSNSAVAPEHLSDFAAYATAFARRYGRGGAFWQAHPGLPQLPVTDYEIWNEENSTVFWRPQADAPERYADLYLATRAAIKDVDPQAGVVVGGLALGNNGGADEIEFVQRMFAHRPDLRGNVDGVGLHPYQRTVADVYARVRSFRLALDRLAGASVPIEITEVGWSTTAVSEAERAADLGALARELPRSDCNVDRLLPYTAVTQESSSSDPEDWFGIFNRDGTPKPSGQAYLDAVKTMRGLTSTPPPTGTVTICHGGDPATAAPIGAASVQRQGPRLLLRVDRDRRRSRLDVIARCPAGCRLRVDLMARRARASEKMRLTRRSTRFSSKRLVISLRITRRLRRRNTRVEVDVLAIDRSGRQTTRSRSVRIR